MQQPVRIVTAVAAFDGHDASVLALNRALLTGQHPVEVIYIGFNMTGEQIAAAALQEGADAVAVSSYNGGHVQFFGHLCQLLGEKGAENTLVFGGGGGTILPEDAERIEDGGVEKIYGPGWPLDEIAADMVGRIRASRPSRPCGDPLTLLEKSLDPRAVSLLLGELEGLQVSGPQDPPPPWFGQLQRRADSSASQVVVMAGDGGAGKSTIIDELARRFLEVFKDRRLAILSNDPTIAKGPQAAAFLADRVRMNHIYDARVLMRSVATRTPYAPLSPALPDLVRGLKAAGYDLILVETPGTGQTGLDLSPFAADLLVYVKTKEFGSGVQLEKDQFLHEADLVVLNKLDLEGAEAAFEQVSDLLARYGKSEALHALVAKVSRDRGLDRLFAAIGRRLGWPAAEGSQSPPDLFSTAKRACLVPHPRRSYLAEIVAKVQQYDRWVERQLDQGRGNPESPAAFDPSCAELLDRWPEMWQELSLQAARRSGAQPWVETPNGLRLPRVALPDPRDRTESLRFLLEEGLPGMFPFATGIYPYRPSTAGETTRQFAGLRGPEETNQRLHLLARGVARPRLSIAFDGITLYGADSDDDSGSIGKIGEGGVSIDSYEDMKLVLKGFRIPEISTSMTINGPAPVILAMYFVAAIELEEERAEEENGAPLSVAEKRALHSQTLHQLRGTVQADILKEVQAQNESIFQTDFAIKLLGDVQQWFIDSQVSRFYSLSISGYHIGEAGASPVQELAFTLANGFTYIENFLARGMAIDDFAPSLSFFFRVSHEAEWLAYGAVCRKIWAIALRDVYGGSERAQKFKFHTQTSGRALQAEEWDTLNPVRQTYHALLGLLANTNSLHVDSADEPMTTPGEKHVRQATMIPNYLREEAEGFVIQNLLSGSYAFRALMREVQQEVLGEFTRIDQLGGVGPATELGYQRRCIAENSTRYERERRRGDGQGEAAKRRIIGYNAHPLPEGHPDKYPPVHQMVRPDPADWERQLARVRDFKKRHAADAPVSLAALKQVAREEKNVFGELLDTVRHATLGQITRTLMEVGGEYRKMV